MAKTVQRLTPFSEKMERREEVVSEAPLGKHQQIQDGGHLAK